MNNKCYTFKEKIYNKGLFDNSIDATYILHLENNGRFEHINNQLKIYQPSKVVYILFNKGFKVCNKNLHINNSLYDLIDAYITIYKDAQQKNYNNILILEDDFIFSKSILNNKNINMINNFINNLKNEKFMYLLGCLPQIQLPTASYYSRRVLFKGGLHACIYSKEIREHILKQNIKYIDDWDLYTDLNCVKYMFYKPLCYQLFPETENQKNWHLYFVAKPVLQFLKLNKQQEPGYTFFYYYSIWVSLLIIYIIIKIINLIMV
jgi:hypothetical protein